MQTIKIKKLHSQAIIPTYATTGSAGMDLYAFLEHNIIINPNDVALVSTGISIELPDDMEAQIRSRSGLAFKRGIQVINSPGTIDPDYRGEIKIALINHNKIPFEIIHGDRIAQMVFAKFERIKFEEISTLSETERGEGGFGSTGVVLEC